jgi:disulfide bond formation protein DsbB
MISIHRILGDSRISFFLFAVISSASLIMAYTAEYSYGLEPCILCLYQRVPFALVIGFAVAGLLLLQKWRYSSPVFLGLITLSFAVNSVIAAYHTGVERKWWPSFLEGCTIPQIEGSITDVLAQIQAAPMVRCDEIPWTDPVLGLSMANYNALMCAALFAAALYSAFLSSQKARQI